MSHELDSYITSDEVTVSCNCGWRMYFERTENMLDEIHEIMEQHRHEVKNKES